MSNNVVSLQVFNAKRLSERVDRSGKTRKQIAEDADLSIQSLYNYEKEEREPSVNVIPRLAKAIGTTSAYLMEEIDDPSPDALNRIKYTEAELEELGYQERSAEGDLADPAKMEAMHLALLREYEAAKRLREYIQRQPQRPTPKKDGG